MDYRHRDTFRNELRRSVTQVRGKGRTASILIWITQIRCCGPAMLLSDKGERMVE
jgi:hypothetical protein